MPLLPQQQHASGSGRSVCADKMLAQAELPSLPLVPCAPKEPRSTSSRGRGGSARGAPGTAPQGNSLVPMPWVHSSVVKYERDATNLWAKWGCGGGPLARELLQLAEELHHQCARDDDRWLPDMRMRRIHQQLLFMVHGLAQQPPTRILTQVMPGDIPEHAIVDALPSLTPRTPPSLTKGENARLRRELADSKNKIESLEQTFAHYVHSKNSVKARDAWLKKYALKGRHFAYDVAFACRAFAAWSRRTAWRKQANLCRRVGAGAIGLAHCRNMKNLLSRCFMAWVSDRSVIAIRRRLIVTFGAWCEQKRAADFQQCFHQYFAMWAQDARVSRLERKLVEANERYDDAVESHIREKQELIERFGASLLAQLRKAIGADQMFCLQTGFSGWLEAAQLQIAERKAGLDADEAERRRLERLKAAGERCFGRARRALLEACVGGWQKVMEEIRRQEELMRSANNDALKRIMGSESQLKRDCISEWATYTRAADAERRLAEMRKAQELLDLARQRAMSLLTRESYNDLRPMCFAGWHEELEKSKWRKFRDDIVMDSILQQIHVQENMMISFCVGYWHMISAAEAQRKQEVSDAISEARARFIVLAQGSIMRLHRRLGVTHVFEAWLKRSVGD